MTEKFETAVSMRKVARLNEQLDRRYGLTLDLGSIDHLLLVQEHYRAKREFILSHYGLAESLSREDYAKSVLISEAIGLFLREIAPTRMKPRTRKERK
jgi:hypothetical protein